MGERELTFAFLARHFSQAWMVRGREVVVAVLPPLGWGGAMPPCVESAKPGIAALKDASVPSL